MTISRGGRKLKAFSSLADDGTPAVDKWIARTPDGAKELENFRAELKKEGALKND